MNQQGDILFATLFTYDIYGDPMWLVMSAGARQGTADTFAGELYRTMGPAFNANLFIPIGASNADVLLSPGAAVAARPMPAGLIHNLSGAGKSGRFTIK